MVYCFLADGFEDIEALAPVDILRRAGVEVKTVGVLDKNVTSSHKVPVVADITMDEVLLDERVQAVILPGGMPGTRHLDASDGVKKAVSFCAEQGKLIGAICAAPSVLGHMGLLSGRDFTCYPGFEEAGEGGNYTAQPVVTDGNIVTAKGAGCAVKFGLTLTAYLLGEQKAQAIADAMMC